MISISLKLVFLIHLILISKLVLWSIICAPKRILPIYFPFRINNSKSIRFSSWNYIDWEKVCFSCLRFLNSGNKIEKLDLNLKSAFVRSKEWQAQKKSCDAIKIFVKANFYPFSFMKNLGKKKCQKNISQLKSPTAIVYWKKIWDGAAEGATKGLLLWRKEAIFYSITYRHF